MTLGVLLAFGLNSWNEERQEKQKVKLFIEDIKVELKENEVELKKALDYHQNLLDGLRKEPMKANLVLNPALVNDVAWSLACLWPLLSIIFCGSKNIRGG